MSYIRNQNHIPNRIRRTSMKKGYDRVSEWGTFCGFNVYHLASSTWRNAVIGLCPGLVILYKYNIAIRIIFHGQYFLFKRIDRIRKGEDLIRQWQFAQDNGYDVITHVKTIEKLDYFSLYKSKKEDRRGKKSRLYATIIKGVPKLLSESEAKLILAY